MAEFMYSFNSYLNCSKYQIHRPPSRISHDAFDMLVITHCWV